MTLHCFYWPYHAVCSLAPGYIAVAMPAIKIWKTGDEVSGLRECIVPLLGALERSPSLLRRNFIENDHWATTRVGLAPYFNLSLSSQ